MISSGGSMFDVIDELNKLKVKHIYIVVTYALFTKGVDQFDEYYKEGKFEDFNALVTKALKLIFLILF